MGGNSSSGATCGDTRELGRFRTTPTGCRDWRHRKEKRSKVKSEQRGCPIHGDSLDSITTRLNRQEDSWVGRENDEGTRNNPGDFTENSQKN